MDLNNNFLKTEDDLKNELKVKCREWALGLTEFPTKSKLTQHIHHYKDNPPPVSMYKLYNLFGSYYNFRDYCGVSQLKRDAKKEVDLDYIRGKCVIEMASTVPGITTPCWLWKGCIDEKGYGRIAVDIITYRVHVFVHEVLGNNPRPHNHSVDHTCRVRHCVNPDHLRHASYSEQALNVTRKQNPKPPSFRPPKHDTLTERVIWYINHCNIDEETGCWTMDGSKSDDYTRIKFNKIDFRLHVLTFLYNRDGYVDKESYKEFTSSHLMACHTCPVDGPPNKKCFNPAHLKEGTLSQNIKDTFSYHGGVILNDKVHDILKKHENNIKNGLNPMESKYQLSIEYGCSMGALADTIRGRRWKDEHNSYYNLSEDDSSVKKNEMIH